MHPKSALIACMTLGLVLTACDSGPKHMGRTLSSWSYDLDSDEEHKVVKACEAMAEFGPQAASEIPKLVKALDHTNEGVVSFCSVALEKIGEAAVPALEEALKSDTPTVRQYAATALLRQNPKHEGAGKELTTAVMGIGDVERAREALALATKVMKGEATPYLQKYLADPYAPVRLQALRALSKIGQPAGAALEDVKALVKDKNAEIRPVAITTLAAIGKKDDIAPYLEKLTDDTDEEIADTAAMMLKHIGARDSASGNDTEESLAKKGKKRKN